MTGPSSERTADADVADAYASAVRDARWRVSENLTTAADVVIATIADDRDRLAALVAQHLDTQEALAAVEWPYDDRASEGVCGACYATESKGHKEGCIIGAALASVRARSET